MCMKEKEFRKKMIDFDDTFISLAEYLRISPLTLRRKVYGYTEFKCGEIKKIAERWNLTTLEIWDIFDSGKVGE